MINWNDYPNFSETEFRCSCCGRADMKPEFMQALQDMRHSAGFPFRVNSGFRCPDYNEKISTTGRGGPHTTGQAVDIGCSGSQAFEIQRLAHLYGMTGIGVSQRGPHMGRFLHLDNLETPPRPNIWSY